MNANRNDGEYYDDIVKHAEDLAVEAILHYSEDSEYHLEQGNSVIDTDSDVYDRAERIVRTVQSHPKLGFGCPSADEVKEILEKTAVKNGEINEPLVDAGVPRRKILDVKESIYDALVKGLEGEVPGPISAPYEVMWEIDEDLVKGEWDRP